MRILDIDLDFFLDRIPFVSMEKAKSGVRLENDQYHPWNEEKVRDFLEKRCGLKEDKKIMGKILVRHDEAFLFWKKLYKIYENPFEIVHIDAHSDLGLDGSWIYIMGYLLNRSLKEREYPEKWIPNSLYSELCNINEGNYIIFAAACRWINMITFVVHPNWSLEQHDFELIHFKNCDYKSGFLQLKKYDPKIFEEDAFGHNNIVYHGKYAPQELEPEIGFNIIQCDEYNDNGEFTFMDLSCSPEFTPSSADKLIPIFKEYIEEF